MDECSHQRFHQTQVKFYLAPILKLPDPNLPFVVEVDASDYVIGAVLSQRHGQPAKLYPWAYFSRKLTSAKINYDVGNKELLSMKAAMDKWRLWLDGAIHSFQVITDHKNLEYVKSAKRLNPRLARWSLFFSRFQFTVTYHPGIKNIKADALSRCHDPPLQDIAPGLILPHSVIITPVNRGIMEEIQRATQQDPPPPYVPHEQAICSPGTTETGHAMGSYLRSSRYLTHHQTNPQRFLVASNEKRCD